MSVTSHYLREPRLGHPEQTNCNASSQPVHCDFWMSSTELMNRDTESREQGNRDCCEGAKRVKPGVWGYVQVREVWSTEEETSSSSGFY